MFHYAHKVTSVSEIDTEDDTCRLGLLPDPDALINSIRAVGVINPPVLRQRQDMKYQIVCGFRRVMALKALDRHEITVRVLLGQLSEFDLLSLAVWDNRSHRSLNVIEQAHGIEKLSAHTPSRNRLPLLASLLGFPPNPKVFRKLRKLCRLPEPVQAGVLEETVSFEAAVHLSELSREDALSFFELFNALKLSQNKQREAITLVQEIAIREGLRPGEILESEGVTTILNRPELNRNEKGTKVRSYLKQRRFPALTKAQERFSKELKALKMNEHIHMTPPPYFEGGEHILRMSFKSMKDFDERRKSLNAMGKNPALRRLLEPWEDE